MVDIGVDVSDELMDTNLLEIRSSNGDADGNDDDDDAVQADSPYTQFLDAEKKKNYVKKRRTVLTVCSLTFIIVFIGIFVAAAVLFAYSSSATNSNSSDRSGAIVSNIQRQICDNPPVFHLSLDGYRADYYKRMLNPNLQSVIDTGVRADYMRSQYPTQTFPNHYTIMTGLYPEYHGIVTNFFYDKVLKEQFVMSSLEPYWWLGEPVWVTARKNGLVSGAYFWPGSEVPGIQPNYFFNFNSSVSLQTRVNTVLSWLDLPKHDRPQFIALYFEEPDHTGHEYGPDSLQVNESIISVDAMLGVLIQGLQERNISDCINLIVTSDHGMQYSSENLTIYLEDYMVNLTDGVQVTYLGPLVQFNVYPPADKASFYNQLKNLPHVQVFYQEDVPYRLRIGHNLKNRYGDIFVIPDTGWFVTSRSESYSFITVRKGEHGYDNNAKTMRAFMAARGPAFKENYTSSSFDNIQLYNLECALLGIPPASNNGTFGALYHLLKPDIVKKLPGEQSFKPLNLENMETCQFPSSSQELYDRLSCSDCICSACTLNTSLLYEADLQLNLTSQAISLLQSHHTFGGIPQGGGGSGSCVLTDPQYINKYSTSLHIPLWVAYRLDGNNLPSSSVPNCVRLNPQVSPSQSANCSQYNADGYVRGTLPNYYSSGMEYFTSQVPQLSSFNQGVWLVLKEKLQGWAIAYSSLYVMSGSILDSDRNGIRDSDESYDRWTNSIGSVAIPSQFYSIAVRCANKSIDISICPVEDVQAIGIVMYHEETYRKATRDYFQFRITSVREIEKITDINFFPEFTASQQNRIELEIIPYLWIDDCSYPSDKMTLEKRTSCSDCVCPYCQVNKTFVKESDVVFNISDPGEVFVYLSNHLPWGVPLGSDDSEACLLTQPYYIIKYSTFYHIPLWVAYKLSASTLNERLDRRDCFRRDPRIAITDSSNCSDYQHSGFDRGHLAPNGDFNSDRFAQLSTFILTNVAPQYHPFNAGVWLAAENKVRTWALNYSVIQVISGSILDDSRRDQEGNYNWWIGGYGHAAVPTRFYKILARCSSSVTDIAECPIGDLKTLTLLFEHVNSGVPKGESDNALLQSLTTIRNIEELTGINFFTHLTKADQDKIELELPKALWD